MPYSICAVGLCSFRRRRNVSYESYPYTESYWVSFTLRFFLNSNNFVRSAVLLIPRCARLSAILELCMYFVCLVTFCYSLRCLSYAYFIFLFKNFCYQCYE